jgi:hypothetical protein
LNARKDDDSGKTGDPDEEELKEDKDSSDAEGDDGDEGSEEDNGQSRDMEEDKDEGNQSVGVVESGKLVSLYIY